MAASLGRIGPYELTAVLGRGGMGVVYAARGPAGEVALKLLGLRGVEGDEGRRRRFGRELEALRRLQHPGLVPVLDAGEERGALWFAMARIEGESLQQRLARGPLPAEKVLELGAQLASALRAAHALGIVHRDVKPDNVLIERGRAAASLERHDASGGPRRAPATRRRCCWRGPGSRSGAATPRRPSAPSRRCRTSACARGWSGPRTSPCWPSARASPTSAAASSCATRCARCSPATPRR
ncbi:MAG: protein kinase [Planctomycetota bacterium]